MRELLINISKYQEIIQQWGGVNEQGTNRQN